jgi:hypothetical protein
MVMVCETSVLLVKEFLLRTGLPDLNDKWFAILILLKNEIIIIQTNIK